MSLANVLSPDLTITGTNISNIDAIFNDGCYTWGAGTTGQTYPSSESSVVIVRDCGTYSTQVCLTDQGNVWFRISYNKSTWTNWSGINVKGMACYPSADAYYINMSSNNGYIFQLGEESGRVYFAKYDSSSTKLAEVTLPWGTVGSNLLTYRYTKTGTVAADTDVTVTHSTLLTAAGISSSQVVTIFVESARPSTSWAEVNPAIFYVPTSGSGQWGFHNYGTGGGYVLDIVIVYKQAL